METTETKISIIVPMYNVEKYIGQCIESVLNQSYKNFELILVDDGSLDSSFNIAKEYSERDRRIILVKQKNGGVSTARNKGLDIASGHYITFLDSDDWLEPDLLLRYIEKTIEQSLDIVFADNYYVNDDVLMQADSGWLYRTDNALNNYLLLPSPISGCRSFYKKSLIEEERFNINLHFHEDTEFQIRILKKEPRAGSIDYPGYHYRQGSATHSYFTAKTLSVFDTIEAVIMDLDGMLSDELLYRISAFIIAILYIAAKDKTHEKEYDAVLKEKIKIYLNKILSSRNISIKNKLKLICYEISPNLLYSIIGA